MYTGLYQLVGLESQFLFIYFLKCRFQYSTSKDTITYGRTFRAMIVLQGVVVNLRQLSTLLIFFTAISTQPDSFDRFAPRPDAI